MTAQFLTPFKKLPWVRAMVIGQPPDLKPPYQVLGESVDTQSGRLRVISTPGHCDDHIVLYDPKEKLLLAGDAFMGSYFATPNPDVDSRKWIESLERLMELDIEILVEGHGHIHTLRADIPDFPGVVVREDPKIALEQKLFYLRWLREQIEAGFQEQLPMRVIEASCFPWGNRTSWESCATDECIRMLSLGHFSRTELVRSFVRTNAESFPPSMKFACPEENDNFVAERARRNRIRCADARFPVDWLDSARGVASGCGLLPQSAAALGVHVGVVVRHFFQPEVADVVEGARPSFASRLAFHSVSVRLAGDGCGRVPGCEAARPFAAHNSLALGDARNSAWRRTAMDCGAIFSRR